MPRAAPWYPWFKAAVFGLLVANTAAYAAIGTASEALDSVAWLTLLAAFELETGLGGRFAEGRLAAALRGVRFVAAAAIFVAGIGYVLDREWLDVANIALWIAVVVLLESGVRYPALAAAQRKRFTAAAATLYSGLAILVLVWLWQGDRFDAYDAALWLVAFATIEINVLGIARNAANRQGAGRSAA
ncbi:MAG: hypothetical protein ACRET6_02680 [Burkholderiales bacterium]